MAALRGLYAVTPDSLCREPDRLERAVASAIAGGARLVQYRDKTADASQRGTLARRLLVLCRARGALLIVNDDVTLAHAIGADGVHVGTADTPVAEARRLLPAGAIVGASCANRLDRAAAAQRDGASYVAFGRFFPSGTKPGAPQADAEVLREARRSLSVPICAIGGITPDRAPGLVAAGADLVAAVEGIFGAPDVEAAARAYARAFSG
jgi:thiamine-phosphate pyrophosphorylase